RQWGDDPPRLEAAGDRLEARQEVDRQPGPRVRAEKSARDRLIRLASTRPDWALGFEDEVWWSRLAAPALHSWAEPDRPLRLVEQAVAKDDPDPKALACYGLLARWAQPGGGWQEETWLRFVDGRPVSALTTQYLAWCAAKLRAAGKRALLLVWDNAGWHVSHEVRGWIRAHNRRVMRVGRGGRVLSLRQRPIRPNVRSTHLSPPQLTSQSTNIDHAPGAPLTPKPTSRRRHPSPT